MKAQELSTKELTSDNANNLAAIEEYENGNYIEAFRLYRLSAEKGDKVALYSLGYMYNYGKGVRLNLVEAFKCYKKSAELGYPDAQHKVNSMYRSRKGVTHNPAEADEYVKLDAERGDKNAAAAFGKFYYDKQSYEEAAKFLIIAGENGDSSLQLNVGRQLVEKDISKALILLKLSEGKGNFYAGNLLLSIYEQYPDDKDFGSIKYMSELFEKVINKAKGKYLTDLKGKFSIYMGTQEDTDIYILLLKDPKKLEPGEDNHFYNAVHAAKGGYFGGEATVITNARNDITHNRKSKESDLAKLKELADSYKPSEIKNVTNEEFVEVQVKGSKPSGSGRFSIINSHKDSATERLLSSKEKSIYGTLG
jgi:hypothetical protein